MIKPIIRGTGMYTPANKFYNEFFISHFDDLGLPSEGLMNHLGRRKRYLASEGETVITMASNAVKDALKKLNMDPSELDMIVFVTDTPEYTIPSQALQLVDIIGAKHVHMAFDLNSNCTGMIVAMEITKTYMSTRKDIKKAAIVGGFHISSIVNKCDTVVYPNFGDASAAIILENVETDEEKGFIDCESYLDASYFQNVTYPKCGLSNITSEAVNVTSKKLEWNPFDFSFISDVWNELIRKVLGRNGLETKDVDYYILPQLSDFDNMKTLTKLGVKEDKYFFLGKEYGYTGNTCPIIVLNRMWNIIAQAGKRVVFCTVGAGFSANAMLYKF